MLSTMMVLKMTSDPHQPLHRSKFTPESFLFISSAKRLPPVFEDAEHGGGVEYDFRPSPTPPPVKTHPRKFFFYISGKTSVHPFSRMLNTMTMLKMTSDPHQPLHREDLAVFERLVDIICDKMSDSLDTDPTLMSGGAKGQRLTDAPPGPPGCQL
ncbi:hypothetical protein NQ318_005871 [Aromia moschata]|uniref:Uncharacterized protein n=1 Tax=Aromia moschata TaxID=1265417 RepID=A0AAV8YS88_9CUCU|nr:hypothetical protein NQ318_005871 [Aromia moschata]